jgi:hypothetical protein
MLVNEIVMILLSISCNQKIGRYLVGRKKAELTIANEKKFKKGSRISDRGLTHDSVSAKTKVEEETCSISIAGSTTFRPDALAGNAILDAGTNEKVLLRIAIIVTKERRTCLDMMLMLI